ncbi:MAG: aconitate hydratase AcnA [Thaumarchaeota archaeon]|nr:aconitate hydratase AcnA [Nitrososphaerota archaeon]
MTGSSRFDSVIDRINSPKGPADFYSLKKLEEQGHDLSKLPYSIRILLENAVRNAATMEQAGDAAMSLLDWPKSVGSGLPFMPYRVLLQDYTGVPLIVDLAAMRDAMKRSGGDPRIVNSKVPMDLIIDHSVQVDGWGDMLAFNFNIEKEYERNSERYSLLKWAQGSFRNLRVFPPGKGICHQVNLEYLATVVALKEQDGRLLAVPDTLVGTDSHTTMVNGLGVLGWGVGGIEAEAVMLGEPYHMPIPRVVGVKIVGQLREGVTPTDIVLTVTELLRSKNAVDAFVEYFGEGYQHLSVPDRATLGNMSPEYGATVGFSPVDQSTIRYLLDTGRDRAHVRFVEEYCKRQDLFILPDSTEPNYSEVLVVDLDKIEACIAGPRNPEERRLLTSVPAFVSSLIEEKRKGRSIPVVTASTTSSSGAQTLVQSRKFGHDASGLDDGSVIIAAITSCTNTSNPTVMIGAGLIAKKAVEKGLAPKAFVKGSLAPGSTVVKDYLEGSGLLSYLDKLGFNLVGYGCTTCIGNSGPLDPAIEASIKQRDLYTVAVLSGNRNFDGRIHPLAKGSFLMSPMLVVAYALAGNIGFDFSQSLGLDKSGEPVFLKDLWPSLAEIKDVASRSLSSDLYKKRYADALKGDDQWTSLPGGSGDTFQWNDRSTYVKEPPWFDHTATATGRQDIDGARVLGFFEDKITTDHISPAGSIAVDSPAGKYLLEHGVGMVRFSTYGARRGDHEVMVRGGFANIRLRNLLADGKEGWYTKYLPTGEVTSIYEAAMRYGKQTPLIILAGKQYGSGSSRDWAAKAPKLLGVRAVIAESFERIHRSNLIAMGIIPLEFPPGQSAKSLGLKGDEVFTLQGLKELGPGAFLDVTAKSGRRKVNFRAKVRIDNQAEIDYYDSGGVLPYVFKRVRSGGT